MRQAMKIWIDVNRDKMYADYGPEWFKDGTWQKVFMEAWAYTSLTRDEWKERFDGDDDYGLLCDVFGQEVPLEVEHIMQVDEPNALQMVDENAKAKIAAEDLMVKQGLLVKAYFKFMPILSRRRETATNTDIIAQLQTGLIDGKYNEVMQKIRELCFGQVPDTIFVKADTDQFRHILNEINDRLKAIDKATKIDADAQAGVLTARAVYLDQVRRYKAYKEALVSNEKAARKTKEAIEQRRRGQLIRYFEHLRHPMKRVRMSPPPPTSGVELLVVVIEEPAVLVEVPVVVEEEEVVPPVLVEPPEPPPPIVIEPIVVEEPIHGFAQTDNAAPVEFAGEREIRAAIQEALQLTPRDQEQMLKELDRYVM